VVVESGSGFCHVKTGRSKSSNLLGGSVLTTVQARVKIHKAIQDRNKTRTGKTPKVV